VWDQHADELVDCLTDLLLQVGVSLGA
jgi:hypothetical protein